MSFYHEWIANQRYDDVLRDARRRDGWRLEGGVLPLEEAGFWKTMSRMLRGEKVVAAPVAVTATPAKVIHVEPHRGQPTKKAS